MFVIKKYTEGCFCSSYFPYFLAGLATVALVSCGKFGFDLATSHKFVLFAVCSMKIRGTPVKSAENGTGGGTVSANIGMQTTVLSQTIWEDKKWQEMTWNRVPFVGICCLEQRQCPSQIVFLWKLKKMMFTATFAASDSGRCGTSGNTSENAGGVASVPNNSMMLVVEWRT